jgi:hypothetical protein
LRAVTPLMTKGNLKFSSSAYFHSITFSGVTFWAKLTAEEYSPSGRKLSEWWGVRKTFPAGESL